MADVTLTAALTGFDGISGAFSGLIDSLSDSEKRAGLFNKAALGLAGAFTGIVASASAAAAVFINSADELSKLSQKTGVSTEELSRLKYAADLSGVSLGGLQTGLVKLANTASEAASGSKSAKDAFDKLGVSVTNSSGDMKSSNVIMSELADRFKKMPDGVEKTAAAIDIFGKSGADMIPLLNSGADGLREMGDEAAKFGAIIDSDAAKSAEILNDNLGKLKGVFSGVINSGLQPILPLIASLSDKFIEAIKQGDGLQKAGKALTAVFKSIVTAGIILKNGIDNIIDVIYAMGKAAYEISQGNFKAAFQSIKTGVNDVGSNYKDVANGIDDVWKETAEKTEKETKKSHVAIKESNKTTQKEIDDAIRRRGENEAFVQNQINDGWKSYYENLAINDKATQAEIEANNKKRAEMEVATAIEINDGWKAYYDNLKINEDTRIEQNRTANEVIGGRMSQWLNSLRMSSTEVYEKIGASLVNMMNMGTYSIANGVAQWIVEGKKFNLEDVFSQMATMFITSILQMGVQWVIFQSAMALGWTTIGTAGAASGFAVNIAWAPITLVILGIIAAVVAVKLIFDEFGVVGVAVAAAITIAFFPVAWPFIAIGIAIVAIIEAIKNWDKVSSWASKSIKAVWEKVTQPFEFLWEVIKKIVDGIKSIADFSPSSIADKIIPKEIGQAGGWAAKNLVPKEIKFWATGTSMVTNGPQMFVAGERGAERVTVEPAGTFRNKGGNGGVSVVNFNAPVIFDEVSARRFVRLQNRYAGGRAI